MVSHLHNMPTDGIECRVCSDTGLYLYDGTWRVCMALHTKGKREQLSREAEGANQVNAKLEAIGGRKK